MIEKEQFEKFGKVETFEQTKPNVYHIVITDGFSTKLHSAIDLMGVIFNNPKINNAFAERFITDDNFCDLVVRIEPVKPLNICVDFDGTCVTHEFPAIGKDIGAIPVLKELTDRGHKLILFTMRSNGQEVGSVLDEAIDWFNHHRIPLDGVNKAPGQEKWTASPKAYGHIYIDDAALGCPLLWDAKISKRPYVDWYEVREMLVERGILNKKETKE